jgi:hypothetical protein
MKTRPPFTFQEMCDMETSFRHVSSGIRNFADPQTYLVMKNVEYLMGEMRHAAGMLVDADEDSREAIAERLIRVFTGTEK